MIRIEYRRDILRAFNIYVDIARINNFYHYQYWKTFDIVKYEDYNSFPPIFKLFLYRYLFTHLLLLHISYKKIYEVKIILIFISSQFHKYTYKKSKINTYAYEISDWENLFRLSKISKQHKEIMLNNT